MIVAGWDANVFGTQEWSVEIIVLNVYDLVVIDRVTTGGASSIPFLLGLRVIICRVSSAVDGLLIAMDWGYGVGLEKTIEFFGLCL